MDCDEYDYSLNVGECKDGQSRHDLNLTHSLCKPKPDQKNSTTFVACDKCKPGDYLKKGNCIECEPGRY